MPVSKGYRERVTGNAKGLWAGIMAFGLWGVLPIYWKHLGFMDPVGIVAQRTCWTCLALWPLLLWRNIGIRLEQVTDFPVSHPA